MDSKYFNVLVGNANPFSIDFFSRNFRIQRRKLRKSTHAGDVVVGADTFLEQAVSDLPREDGRALALVEGNLAHDFGGGHAGLAAADGSGPDRPGLVVPAIIIICGTIRYTTLERKLLFFMCGNGKRNTLV